MGVGSRAIHRIDYPAIATPGKDVLTLFPDKIMTRELFSDLVNQIIFNLFIDNGNQIPGTFITNLFRAELMLVINANLTCSCHMVFDKIDQCFALFIYENGVLSDLPGH